MQKRTTIYLILLIMLLFLLVPGYTCKENSWWDDSWSYQKEIKIPFDTDLELAIFQPIDTKIDFDKPCWAKNKTTHSIRVICWDEIKWKELESQIYDLEFISENYIKSCNLVFLIPEFADGDEKYYVYYDESEKNDPNYQDYVDVEESYYHIEPISGYPLESQYYRIFENEYIVYAISQEGQFMGYNTSQHVTRMNEKTTEVMPKNGDVFASFDIKYSYDDGLFDYSSTSQHLVSKEIFEDGNLMIEVGLVSRSNRNDIQTSATYKYYYCPTPIKRIHAYVKHETLREIQLDPKLKIDGIFAQLRCFDVKSNSIDDLNYGKILPNMHIYNENDNVAKYSIDTDPEYIPESPDIRILRSQDDIDLGGSSWVSFDEGEKGIVHSLILGSNSILKSGTDEEDGVQVNAFIMDFPHLPGLENNMAAIELGRNSYENNIHDLIIPADYVIEFHADFLSSEEEGFNIVQSEAIIFQELIKIKPESKYIFTDDYDIIEKHDLSLFIHLAPSLPFGSELSAILGRDFPYITAEVYMNEEFVSSGTAKKLPMKPIPNLDELSPMKKISTLLSIFDFRNLSFTKTISFLDLEVGRYIVKIFRENPLIGDQRKYIGFKVIDLNENKKLRIYCRNQGNINVNLFDQNDINVENVEVILLNGKNIVSKNTTDKKGNALIKAPTAISKYYHLLIIYNGFVISNESINLPYKTIFIPTQKSFDIERFNLRLKILDLWNLPLEVDINPILSSDEMYEKIILTAEKIGSSDFLFENLIPGSYILSIKYKSFTLDQDINIDSNVEATIDFLAKFDTKLNVLDSRGSTIKDINVIISRENNKLVTQVENDLLLLSLPPGTYKVEVFDNGDLIGLRNIDIFQNTNYDILTKNEPLFPLVAIILSISMILLSLLYSYLKKEKIFFILFLSLSLLIISIVSPWWMINGSNSYVETSTNMFLLPLELVTLIKTNLLITGELAYLPDIFIDYIGLIPIFSILSSISILIGLFFNKKNKNNYFFICLTFSFFLLLISLFIFIIGMSSLTEVGIGSFIGTGVLDISIPGEESINSVSSSWGPNIGFYLYVLSITIILLIILINISKIFLKK